MAVAGFLTYGVSLAAAFPVSQWRLWRPPDYSGGTVADFHRSSLLCPQAKALGPPLAYDPKRVASAAPVNKGKDPGAVSISIAQGWQPLHSAAHVCPFPQKSR